MERVVESISISTIVIDRFPINPSTLNLIDYIRDGGDVPPIQVIKIRNGRYKIKDGRHRVLAYKLIGIDKIEAKFAPIVNKR